MRIGRPAKTALLTAADAVAAPVCFYLALAHAQATLVPQVPAVPSALVAAVLTVAGLALTILGARLLVGGAVELALSFGLSETLIGLTIVAVGTSLPELVTSVAAVRRGALTLAVGGIIGGNAYDTLFSAAADIAYREGSIYHAMPRSVSFWAALSLLMAAVLSMGLIRRETQGPGGVGMESVGILVLYAAGVTILLVMGQ